MTHHVMPMLDARAQNDRRAYEPRVPPGWIQTSSGKAFDLLSPRAEDVDFCLDIAPALARIPRFNGHMRPSILQPFAPSPGYSVAQHCALGAKSLIENGERGVALLFLLHDAHTAYVGDISAPVETALGPEAKIALKSLKYRIDVAIHLAAGCEDFFDPLASWKLERVKELDLAMLRAERNALHHLPSKPWGPAIEKAERLAIRIHPVWDAAQAAAEWLELFAIVRPCRPFAAPPLARDPRVKPGEERAAPTATGERIRSLTEVTP